MTSFNYSDVSQNLLTPAQYGMSYRQAKPDEIERNRRKVNELSDQYIVVAGREPDEQRPLISAHWSGNKLMILRNKPVVLDYCRFEAEKDEHSRLYSELLLFRPWRKERRFIYRSPSLEECRVIHKYERAAIQQVKQDLNTLLLEQI